jgi:hypothetical protein
MYNGSKNPHKKEWGKEEEAIVEAVSNVGYGHSYYGAIYFLTPSHFTWTL